MTNTLSIALKRRPQYFPFGNREVVVVRLYGSNGGAGLAAIVLSLVAAQSEAMQMVYSPSLPQFGGMNGQALSVLQFEQQLEDRRDAERAASAREAERALASASAPARRLTDTITNYLNVEIARRISSEILDGDRQSNTIGIDGGVTISYVRDAGNVVVTILDGVGGETTVTLPDISEAP